MSARVALGLTLVLVACDAPSPAPSASASSSAPPAATSSAPTPVAPASASATTTERPLVRAPAELGQINIAVDPRVELLSILCRLAKHPPYNDIRFDTPYTRAVDEHFGPFKEHAAVKATADLRARFGINYDAPMTLAVYLDAAYKPVRALSPAPPGLDPRFEKAPLDAYLPMIEAFARNSEFEAFMTAQRPYIEKVEDRYRSALQRVTIIPWFDEVFGPRPNARYHLVPGLLSGPMAYGVRAEHDGKEDIVQIMYLENTDASGAPQISDATVEYLIHELAHSYVNPIVDGAKSELEKAAADAYKSVSKEMAQQHYATADVFVKESLVRAITIIYLEEQSVASRAQASRELQERLAFKWTPQLVSALQAVRDKRGGRLPPEDLVATAKTVFGARN
ncbi:MAG: DUF4932 domain-containing protein [Polyangiaceae bacterium]